LRCDFENGITIKVSILQQRAIEASPPALINITGLGSKAMSIDRLERPAFPAASAVSPALPDRREAKLKGRTGWDTPQQPPVRLAQAVTAPVGAGFGPAAFINAVPQARLGTRENRAMNPWTPEAREQAAPVWNRFTRAWRRAGYLWNEGTRANFTALRGGFMGDYPEQVEYPEHFPAARPGGLTVATPIREAGKDDILVGGVNKPADVRLPQEGYRTPPLPIPANGVIGDSSPVAAPPGIIVHMARPSGIAGDGYDARGRASVSTDGTRDPDKHNPHLKNGDPKKAAEWMRGWNQWEADHGIR
jgi:hypothetical protein